VSVEATELAHHAQPSVQEIACQENLGQHEPNVGRVQHCQIKLFELHFHITQVVLFCSSGLKITGYENTDNNLESYFTIYKYNNLIAL
jgi:hypothetical protein